MLRDLSINASLWSRGFWLSTFLAFILEVRTLLGDLQNCIAWLVPTRIVWEISNYLYHFLRHYIAVGMEHCFNGCLLFHVILVLVATGFPSGQTHLKTRLEEIRLAVADGAREIDIVINRQYALSGNWKGELIHLHVHVHWYFGILTTLKDTESGQNL